MTENKPKCFGKWDGIASPKCIECEYALECYNATEDTVIGE